MNFSKKLCILTVGCPENRIDAARMQKFFKQNGWFITSDFKQADVIIFNTCGLTQDWEEKSIEIVNHIKAQKKASSELIVSGCLSRINKDRLREVYQGPTFVSSELESLNEIFNTKTKVNEIHANFLLPLVHLNKRKASYFRKIKKIKEIGIPMAINLLSCGSWFWYRHEQIRQAINVYNPYTYCIKISTGCLNACTYCAIRFSRGKVKSKSINDIVKEFKEGLEKNYKEFALIGTDLGAYGKDQGTNLVALLKEILKKKGDYKIKLRNIQPRFLIQMMPELREIFQSGRISYLSSAAESGNNRILNLMHRGYKIEDFKDVIRNLRREFPEIKIRTQLMVGFPSETEEEFQDTVRLLDALNFDFVEIYRFQPRPGTEASKMEYQIPKRIVTRRYYSLYIKSLTNEKRRKKKALKEYKAFLKREDQRQTLLSS